MAEPLKFLFNPEMVAQMAGHLKRVHPQFDADAFVAIAIAEFDAQELKQRSNAVSLALENYLPANFSDAAAILVAALHPVEDAEIQEMQMDTRGIRGWAIAPIADYVARRGRDDFDLGMETLKALTKRLTAEFGIRAFILHDCERALTHLRTWVSDPNAHVRRLVSEGTRPYLPWGQRLPDFAADPTPVLPFLAALRDDDSPYVRRSVANHLNDIAREHPDLVADIAHDWMHNAPKSRQALIKHGLRNLIKLGHPAALAVLGVGPPQLRCENFVLSPPQVQLGGAVTFNCTLTSTSATHQNLIVDYAIHHVKANGTTTPKVFKWSNFVLEPGQIRRLERVHVIRPITTRTYYSGTHKVDIRINGRSFGELPFELIVPDATL